MPQNLPYLNNLSTSKHGASSTFISGSRKADSSAEMVETETNPTQSNSADWIWYLIAGVIIVVGIAMGLLGGS